MKRNHLTLRILAGAWLLLLFEGAWQLAWEANGTGEVLGRFSAGWSVVLSGYVIAGGVLGLLGLAALLRPQILLTRIIEPVERAAARLGRARWLVAGLLIILPTAAIFGPSHPYLSMTSLRAILMFLSAGAAAIVMPSDRGSRASRIVLSALVAASVFVFTREFSDVVSYPFKLGWSEGNRIWDYSLYFARDSYDVVGTFSYPTYMAPGRHGLWGLPFLIPNVPIWTLRLWDAVLWTVPYLVLGWVLARRHLGNPKLVGIFTLWTFLFLAQASVYAPLVLSAVLLVLGFRRDRLIWTALVAGVASFYAGISRWTWLIGPATWATAWALVEQRGSSLREKVGKPAFIAVLGLAGGLASRVFMDYFFPEPGPVYATAFSQDLLWYRLLPSPTNPIGLIPGLILAVFPVLSGFLYAARRGWFRWDRLQWLGVATALSGFLAMGIVASVKIGGGNNLHNFDMFLVALIILVLVAMGQLRRRGHWDDFRQHPWIRASLALAVVIPIWWVLRAGGPLSLPSTEVTQASLSALREQVESEAEEGLVLFIDQRQLLTFDQIEAVPLVLDYELKHLMNQAMADNEAYLRRFEHDLAQARFELIVVDPQRIQTLGRSHQFGEENDAWVEHVSTALLEHYEPSLRLNEVGVWTMVPRSEGSPGP